MRSILQEASSIPKAVEKAWNDAGMPEEFTIRIFDAGEKNFLGFTKRPAVVSIIFDPRKSIQKIQNESVKFERDDRNDNDRDGCYDKRRFDRYNGGGRQNGYRRADRRSYSNDKRYDDTRYDRGDEYTRRNGYQEGAFWNDEAVEDVRGWLKEITSVMNIGISFTAYADNHLLRIEFEKPVCEVPSDERMLFSSFAYILMQFLKRKHKRKFKACRLAISSRR